jgi:hypothetical protein
MLALMTASGSALGCGSDGSSGVCMPNNLNHPYDSSTTAIEMRLSQNCSSGAVTGTLYDADSFAYDLTGTVSGDSFTFTAIRERPSGDGSDTYSGTAWEVLNNGITLRGLLTFNGGGSGSTTFMAFSE